MKLKTAWDWFSKYIRKKACLKFREKCNEYTGEYVKCTTCNIIKPWKEMDAGHFIHGISLSYMDERNVHVQCAQCNMFLSGNLGVYTQFMLDTYGQDVIDEIEVLNKNKTCFDQDMIKEESDKYRKKFKKIENE